MVLLDARDGYRRWAPTYEGETAISHLENRLVQTLTPPLAGCRLLDAGCGTGRRLDHAGAREAFGIDFSADMLAAGIGIGTVRPGITTAIGDLRALPAPDAHFDIVWCRLAIGHVREFEQVYAELGRVTSPSGVVIVTDFHAVAYSAGHRRTFRDETGRHEIVHHVHPASAQIAAARAAGLRLTALRQARIDRSVLAYYRDAGREPLFAEHFGLPVVLALAFRREG